MKIDTQANELGNIQSSLDYFLKFNLPRDVRILDVGCNYGSLIYNLYKQGYKNVQGIDVNRDSVATGKKEYPVISTKINPYSGKEIPFKENSFDVVLMFDVIEHIPQVQDFLKEQVSRVLKKDGLLIFQTPNKLTNIPWEIIYHKSFSKWKEYHISLQTKNSLKNILNESKFNKIHLEKFNICTNHNIDLVGAKVTKPLAKIALSLLSNLPLGLSSNFWGYARK